MALTDSGPDNAGMRVIPGSHRLGDLPHRTTDDPHNVLSRGETVALDVDERGAVLVTLRAGEMSLHHLRTLHASPPNPSDRPRVGYAIRYMAPSMRPRGGPAVRKDEPARGVRVARSSRAVRRADRELPPPGTEP